MSFIGALGLFGCASTSTPIAFDTAAPRYEMAERRRCAGQATERCYAEHANPEALVECLSRTIGACEERRQPMYASSRAR